MQNLRVTSLDRTFNIGFGLSVNEPFPQLESDERPPSRPTIDEYPELLGPMDDPEDEEQREFEVQWSEWRRTNSFTLAGSLILKVLYVAPDRYVHFTTAICKKRKKNTFCWSPSSASLEYVKKNIFSCNADFNSIIQSNIYRKYRNTCREIL